MPIVLMPDGQKVNMPDQLSPEEGKRLRGYLDSLKQTAKPKEPSITDRMIDPTIQLGKEWMKTGGDFVKKGALPTAGAIGGGALGAISPVPGGAYIGEAAGGALGEYLNQKLGITEQSPLNIALSGGLPLAARGLTGAARWAAGKIAPELPGASAIFQEEALHQAQQAPEMIKVPTRAKAIYRNLETVNPEIDMQNAVHQAERFLRKEDITFRGLKYPKVKGLTEDIIKTTEDNKSMSFQQVWQNMKRLGKRIGQTRAQGGEEYGSYKKLYEAMWNDLDTASEKLPDDIGGSLRQANNAYRREMAREDLAEQIKKSVEVQSQTGIEYVRPKMVLNWMTKSRDSEFFKKSMSEAEYKEIKDLFTKIVKLKPLPPPGAAQYGSGRVLARGFTAAGVGYAAGGVPGAIAAGSMATYVPQLISRALTTESGRAALKEIVAQGTFTLDYPTIAYLVQAVGAGVRNSPNTESKVERTPEE